MRLIVTSFLFLGWGFYELSGGADFEPEVAEMIEPATIEVEEIPAVETVATKTEQTQTTTVATIEPTVQPEPEIKPQVASFVVIEDVPAVESAPELPVEAPTIVEGINVPIEALDIRLVDKPRVNVRSGPGTNYGIAARLVAGDETQIIEDLGNGWVQVKMEDGKIGWMADFLLTPKTVE